jgi:hypothetical protein
VQLRFQGVCAATGDGACDALHKGSTLDSGRRQPLTPIEVLEQRALSKEVSKGHRHEQAPLGFVLEALPHAHVAACERERERHGEATDERVRASRHASECGQE